MSGQYHLIQIITVRPPPLPSSNAMKVKGLLRILHEKRGMTDAAFLNYNSSQGSHYFIAMFLPSVYGCNLWKLDFLISIH